MDLNEMATLEKVRWFVATCCPHRFAQMSGVGKTGLVSRRDQGIGARGKKEIRDETTVVHIAVKKSVSVERAKRWMQAAW